MSEIVLSASRFGLYLSVGFLVGLLATLRWVVVPGFAGLADRHWSTRRALVGRRLEQGVVAAAALAAVASAAALVTQILQVKNFLAAPLGESVVSVVTSSYGLWTAFRIPVAVLLAVLLVGGVSTRVSGAGGVPSARGGGGAGPVQPPGEGLPAEGRGWWLLWAALAGFLLLSMSMTGHPAGASPVWLAVPVDSLHMASATTWLTGLAVLALVLPMAWSGRNDKARVAVLAPAIGRFAGLATGSVLVATVTGAASILLIVDEPGELVGSGYGDALAVKLWTFLWILAFAAVNHFVLVKRLRRLHEGVPDGSAGAGGTAAKPRRPAAGEVREQRASALAAVAMNLAAELVCGVLVLVATLSLVSQTHP